MGRRIFHPEIFQGNLKKKSYFEGWYFKHSTPADSSGSTPKVVAVIPGISLVRDDDRHAFIQILTSDHSSCYIPFDIRDFYAEKNRFSVQIGSNHFSRKGITLSIDHPDISISGTLEYEGTVPFPVTLASPGIMGWYGYVPFMECFHGVVSMNHTVRGSLTVRGEAISFTGGKGYIEKDWGTSFPKNYIWAQSNDFPDKRVSCMLSVASIPWLRREFTGFLCFLHTGEELYRFATYTRSSIKELAVSDSTVSIRISDSRYDMWMRISKQDGGSLAAPNRGTMDRYIKESVVSGMRITLKDKQGKMLFDSTGEPGGFEIVGDIDKLV